MRAFLLALLAVFVAGAALAAPSFPPLTGRVVDDAHVLQPQVQSDLTAKLAALEAQTGRQLVVVTLPSLQGYDISDYGYQLGRAWGIGQKGQNNGVLFIVAPTEHKVRVEVGYGLEPILTDALSSIILQEKVLPRFRAGDVQGGVVDGTDALIQQLALPADQARGQCRGGRAGAGAAAAQGERDRRHLRRPVPVLDPVGLRRRPGRTARRSLGLVAPAAPVVVRRAAGRLGRWRFRRRRRGRRLRWRRRLLRRRRRLGGW